MPATRRSRRSSIASMAVGGNLPRPTCTSVPTMARHTLAVSSMVLFTGAMREAGLTWENGDEALEGKIFDIVVESKDDGAELRKYVGCSFASGDVEVQAHQIVVSNAQFYALDVVGVGV